MKSKIQVVFFSLLSIFKNLNLIAMPIKKYNKKLAGYLVKKLVCLVLIITAIKNNANTAEQYKEVLLFVNNLCDKKTS